MKHTISLLFLALAAALFGGVESCGSSYPGRNLLYDNETAMTNITTEEDDGGFVGTGNGTDDQGAGTGVFNLPGTACGTKSPSEHGILKMDRAFCEWKENDEKKHRDGRALNRLLAGKVNYKIPTYFHIIQKDSSVGRVSNQQVKEGYMRSLNNAFSDTGFTFVLEKISRIINEDAYYCGSKNMYKVKKRHNVRGSNVLNIYVCDPHTAHLRHSKGFAYGFSSYPYSAQTNYDGIAIINPQRLGKNKAYGYIIHEVNVTFRF